MIAIAAGWNNKTRFCLFLRRMPEIDTIFLFTPFSSSPYPALYKAYNREELISVHFFLLSSAENILFITTESFSFQAVKHNEISWQNHKRFVEGWRGLDKNKEVERATNSVPQRNRNLTQ